MNDLFQLPQLKCLRCGHRWIPRKSGRPHRCPKCKSPYWDSPRKINNMSQTQDKMTPGTAGTAQ